MMLLIDTSYISTPAYQQILQREIPTLHHVALSNAHDWITLNANADTLVLCDIDIYLSNALVDASGNEWRNPVIVLAGSGQGAEIAQAWAKGARTCWIKNDLPQDILQQIKRYHTSLRSATKSLAEDFANTSKAQDLRDLSAAAAQQQKLLAPFATFGHYHVSHQFQPASYLSGDWLDYWRLDEAHILFYVADVSGHGVCSSMLSNWLIGFRGAILEPRILLDKINTRLIALNTGKHITMFVGKLNINTHALTWCSAGQYPPAFIIPASPNQPITLLESQNLPLGLSPTLNSFEITTTLSPHDRLVICSDGALEVFSGTLGEQFIQLQSSLQERTFIPTSSLPDDLAVLTISYQDSAT